jgi:hypothetical protein
VIAELALAAAFAAPQTSPGVSVAATIPEAGVISARAVGHHLYVSSLTGVSVLDISNPRAPVRVGRLDLPNAQNEDVDVGSGILLVSDDPAGGRGILHVIDVRDPARPRVLSRCSSWLRSRGSATPRRASSAAATRGWRAPRAASRWSICAIPRIRGGPAGSARAPQGAGSGPTTCRSTAPGWRG